MCKMRSEVHADGCGGGCFDGCQDEKIALAGGVSPCSHRAWRSGRQRERERESTRHRATNRQCEQQHATLGHQWRRFCESTQKALAVDLQGPLDHGGPWCGWLCEFCILRSACGTSRNLSGSSRGRRAGERRARKAKPAEATAL